MFQDKRQKDPLRNGCALLDFWCAINMNSLFGVPAPMPEAVQSAHSPMVDVTGEHWPESDPPHPHRLIAPVHPALEQQILDVPQRQREPYVHYHSGG